jgi:hypothetical protein
VLVSPRSEITRNQNQRVVVPKRPWHAILTCFVLICFSTIAFADSSRAKSAIVVYGDSSLDWVAHIQTFVDLLDRRDRPMVIAGGKMTAIPDNSTLLWFGDLDHNPSETLDLPTEMELSANDLGAEVSEKARELAEGEVRVDENCFLTSTDREDGLPRIAVNFSGEDPQDFCKGLTIASVLGKHGRWLRNDGSQCAWRDCTLMLLESTP